MDRAQETEAKKTTLIDNLNEVTIRFLDQNAEWQEQWPPLNATGGADSGNTTELIGIEIILDLKDWGEIRRLYAMN